MNASPRPSPQLWHNRTTQMTNVIRAAQVSRRVLIVLSNMLLTLMLAMKVGAHAFEAWEWFHSLWFVW